MILHLAAFTWTDDVTPEDVAELTAALRAMAAGIPELRTYHCGENLRLRPSAADYGVAAIVDDEDGLAAYLDSRGARGGLRRLLGRMIASASAAQLDLRPDAGR